MFVFCILNCGICLVVSTSWFWFSCAGVLWVCFACVFIVLGLRVITCIWKLADELWCLPVAWVLLMGASDLCGGWLLTACLGWRD